MAGSDIIGEMTRQAAESIVAATAAMATRRGFDTANRWLTSAHTAVQANSVGRYVNYAEPDTPASRYFGANLERLVAVRQKYDPAGLMYSAL